MEAWSSLIKLDVRAETVFRDGNSCADVSSLFALTDTHWGCCALSCESPVCERRHGPAQAAVASQRRCVGYVGGLQAVEDALDLVDCWRELYPGNETPGLTLATPAIKRQKEENAIVPAGGVRCPLMTSGGDGGFFLAGGAP
jgi:hypothetical protein